MDEPFVPITVTVPRSRAGDLHTFAATLYSSAPSGVPELAAVSEARIDIGEGVWGVDRDAMRIAGPGLTHDAAKRSYDGGDSEYWRPFLQLLAHRPERWVHWPDLYNGLGLKNVQAAGMLGAAERRCKGLPPYVKSWEKGNEHYFWMPQDVADLFLTFAAAG